MQYNVIAVDYKPLATWDNYFKAAQNAVRVGLLAGEVIGVNLLLNGLGQSPDQIHAIGHSLSGPPPGLGSLGSRTPGQPMIRPQPPIPSPLHQEPQHSRILLDPGPGLTRWELVQKYNSHILF